MTSPAGTPSRHLRLLRRAPMSGEIGHPGTCPLCTTLDASAPPCLACRDELRARLLEMDAVHMTELALN